MLTAIELLRRGRGDEIWSRYCGFIDLGMAEFMEIQNGLLLEQIQRLGQCELGRKLLGDGVPDTVEAFRRDVPLTTYEDYIPYLTEKQEDVLPEAPYVWTRTSGRSGAYDTKWVPYTRGQYEKFSLYMLAGFIFASTEQKGAFVFEEGDIMFATLGPPPYVSGAVIGPGSLEHFPFTCIPPLDAEGGDFQERIAQGFQVALRDGIDVCYALASVLVRVGEQFERQSSNFDAKQLLQPKVALRLAKGLIKSKLAGRPLLPKDLWTVKAVAAGGTDMDIYRDRIEYYWGKAPLEGYACTELGLTSFTTWNTSLTFVPDMSFWEFIPEEEHLRSRQDPAYQPRTVLLDEVQPGQIYEIVGTNFHGGAFVRYRVGDLVEITARRDEEHGIDIPQMVFHARADDIIDLGGFTRLTERSIAWALENAKIAYSDWTARKDAGESGPRIHLYIEGKDHEHRDAQAVGQAVHGCLQDLEPEYRDWIEVMHGDPPVVTLLSPGTFERYMAEKQAQGADLAQLKPVRMKPSDEVMADLLRQST
jgi:hypothetical protein